MKRRTKILLLLVSALVLALVFGFIFLLPHGGYRRAVAAYKKQLLAQGEKLTMVEIAPPPSTNASNAADAFMEALKKFKFSQNMRSLYTKTIAPGVAVFGFPNDEPELTNNYEENVRQMAGLRGLLNGSTLDFHLDYSLGILGPEVPVVSAKSPEQLAVATVTQALHANNYTEAWPDVLAAVDLTWLFNDDPRALSDLVRYALVRLAVAATWEALHSGHPWSDSQLAELQARWQGMDFFARSESVMAMERASGVAELAEFRGPEYGPRNSLAEVWADASIGYQNTNGGPLGKLWYKVKSLYDRYPGFWLWKSSWSYAEELYLLQLTSSAKSAAHRMLATGAFAPAYDELMGETTNILKSHPKAGKKFMVFTPENNEAYAKDLLICAGAETVRRMTVTAIALERFHNQHNAYPTSLSELVPAFLSQVPIDFMDGKPLRYKLKPDGNFLLYSVGEDGKDDGGDATLPGSTKDWVRARDIVWPRAATPQELDDYLKHPPTETNSPAR